MNMNQMIPLFLDYCRSKQLRPKTMQSYEQSLRLFTGWLEEEGDVQKVSEIKEMTIRRYILKLQSRGKYAVSADARTRLINHPENRGDYLTPVTNTTINNYLRNLRVFFTWLEEIEYLTKSPMRRIRLLPQQRKPKEYLSDVEVKCLLGNFDTESFCEYRDLMITMLMLDSGTRLGETLSIEDSQLDLFNQSLLLPGEKTKSRKDRTVFFSLKLAKELRRWQKYKDDACVSPYLFPVEDTGYPLKIANYEANFRKYVQRTGIQKHISPHTLRNNFAKRCLLNGMDVYTLSRILGHSSIKVTERSYLDITDDDLKKNYQNRSPLEGIYYRR